MAGGSRAKSQVDSKDSNKITAENPVVNAQAASKGAEASPAAASSPATEPQARTGQQKTHVQQTKKPVSIQQKNTAQGNQESMPKGNNPSKQPRDPAQDGKDPAQSSLPKNCQCSGEKCKGVMCVSDVSALIAEKVQVYALLMMSASKTPDKGQYDWLMRTDNANEIKQWLIDLTLENEPTAKNIRDGAWNEHTNAMLLKIFCKKLAEARLNEMRASEKELEEIKKGCEGKIQGLEKELKDANNKASEAAGRAALQIKALEIALKEGCDKGNEAAGRAALQIKALEIALKEACDKGNEAAGRAAEALKKSQSEVTNLNKKNSELAQANRDMKANHAGEVDKAKGELGGLTEKFSKTATLLEQKSAAVEALKITVTDMKTATQKKDTEAQERAAEMAILKKNQELAAANLEESDKKRGVLEQANKELEGRLSELTGELRAM